MGKLCYFIGLERLREVDFMASYEEIVNPTLIENTTIKILYLNDAAKAYKITANDGYVLHDNVLDTVVFDDVTREPTGEVVLGYSAGTKSCGINYDWDANPREFYAVLRSTVPENQIFSGTTKK